MPSDMTPEQNRVDELRKKINEFFERAEAFENSEGKPPDEDAQGLELFQTILQLLEQCQVDMGTWEALGDNQVWVLEVIAEGAEPATAVEAAYYELSRPDNQSQ